MHNIYDRKRYIIIFFYFYQLKEEKKGMKVKVGTMKFQELAKEVINDIRNIKY